MSFNCAFQTDALVCPYHQWTYSTPTLDYNCLDVVIPTILQLQSPRPFNKINSNERDPRFLRQQGGSSTACVQPLSKQLPVSHLLQVRLPELPLEVWGPFVFVIADNGAEGDAAPVREQMQAVQVTAGSGVAVLLGLML
jgi:phenylpropionate dioxygenase-like ring-hydroxylating dioxygenase large terminal subunit